MHGAVRVDAPLLLPRTEPGMYREEEQCVTVMTRWVVPAVLAVRHRHDQGRG